MRFSFWLRNTTARMISLIKYVLERLGFVEHFESIRLRKFPKTTTFDTAAKFDNVFMHAIWGGESQEFMKLKEMSRSQIKQDLFVLKELEYKKNGFFVEFGATNGIDLSNSFLLESEFSWQGILAEPGRIWRNDLRKNRPNAKIEERLVWKDSGSKLLFNETAMAEFSTIDLLSNRDVHRGHRENGGKYEVETISLNDLLSKHKAPSIIDYLSIDTEGSEYEILSGLDFGKYGFRVITCEHNYSKQRNLIYKLLTKHGYVRKHEEISLFDDWYVQMS
jgi:FkbM family methyltransferase